MTFTDWKNYFQQNQNHFNWLDNSQLDYFTANELSLLSKTLQTFQKGENSEGKNLIKYAREYGNPEYLETIKYFIREEQTHALVLGKLMTHNEIPKIKDQWTDTVFRGLRNVAGLEMSVAVLITAEIIAAIFYKALMHSSSNETLKNICHRILIDEEMHINFQSYTLKTISKSQSSFRKSGMRIFHRFLMEGTIWVVYADHRKVLSAGGYSLKRWRNEVLTEFKRAAKMISGDLEIELTYTAPNEDYTPQVSGDSRQLVSASTSSV